MELGSDNSEQLKLLERRGTRRVDRGPTRLTRRRRRVSWLRESVIRLRESWNTTAGLVKLVLLVLNVMVWLAVLVLSLTVH
jgi:hypothetical protein